ncbi:MAG: hypothetical protein PHY92_06770 [Alphaproteobacteria bacterium]|nr:hypothetical protein [Alphaproteobacteria bacterium]
MHNAQLENDIRSALSVVERRKFSDPYDAILYPENYYRDWYLSDWMVRLGPIVCGYSDNLEAKYNVTPTLFIKRRDDREWAIEIKMTGSPWLKVISNPERMITFYKFADYEFRSSFTTESERAFRIKHGLALGADGHWTEAINTDEGPGQLVWPALNQAFGINIEHFAAHFAEILTPFCRPERAPEKGGVIVDKTMSRMQGTIFYRSAALEL